MLSGSVTTVAKAMLLQNKMNVQADDCGAPIRQTIEHRQEEDGSVDGYEDKEEPEPE